MHRAGERRRAERNDRRDLQPARGLVRHPVEVEAEVPDRVRRPGRGDPHVRRVEVAHHEADDPPQLVGSAGRGRARAVGLARGVPVHAAERRIEEVVAQQRPRLPEDGQLVLGEIDRGLGGHRERTGFTPIDRDDVDAAVVEVVDLFAVRRDLRIGLVAGRRRELAGHRPLR